MNKRRITMAAIGLAVLTATAATADAVIEHKVEQRVGDMVACRFDTAKDVAVDLGRPLAGLRALTGDVGDVNVSADDVQRQGMELDIDAQLHDVSTSGTSSGGTATATIAYGELGEKLPDAKGGLTPGTDGTHLILNGSMGTVGLPVTVVTDLSTTRNSVTITPASITVMGREIPVERVSSMPRAAELADKLQPRTVEVENLPDGTAITGAHVTDSGLALDFSLAPKSTTKPAGGSQECPA
ncbi:LmeA family phospholipid-binding protein [Streptomyces sp. NPDC102365]|uniref:LmeA family phospholipid-binding protein n=1 Tax=Streptomyces sp. NPDC102365 TaxID=3366162 RepID=UPI003810716C